MIYYDTDSIKVDEKYIVKMQEKAWTYWKAMDEAIRALEEKLIREYIENDEKAIREAMEDEKSIHNI